MKKYLFFFFILPLILFGQAQSLFFSEYDEGSSNNKALEIFNGTGAEVDLSNYRIAQAVNGGGWKYYHTFPAGATLANNDVWVMVADAIDPSLFDPSNADEVLAYPSVVHFNGDDARALQITTDGGNNWTTIDVIGEPDNDPGNGWAVAGVAEATKDHTLIRKSTVNKGNTDWASSAGTDADNSEWIVKDQNYFSDLGKHTFEGGTPPTGDGTGTVTVQPNEVTADTTVDLTFTCIGDSGYTLTQLQLTVASGWSWSQNSADVSLSGDAFTTATVTVTQDTILLENIQLSDSVNGTIVVHQLTAPDQMTNSVFTIKTAVSGGTLTAIAVSPAVRITVPTPFVSIKDIQENEATYDGQTVKIRAVVAIGVNITRNDRTDAYVQDTSGRGINLSDASTDHPELVRGNLLEIEGTVSNYTDKNGDVTTQLGNFTLSLISQGNDVPALAHMTTAQAGNIDLEGTFIQTVGIISDKATGIAGGTNITIDDGSGPLQMRIWDTSGLDLSSFAVGDTMGVRGIIDSYKGRAQLLVGYQQDVFKSHLAPSSDGKGLVSVEPDSVGRKESVSLQFTMSVSEEDTLGEVQLVLPGNWQWTNSSGDVVAADGFNGANVTVDNSVITLSGLELNASQTGTLTINNLTSPDADTSSTFTFQTAGLNGKLKAIENQPVVLVGKGTSISTISIKDARELPAGSSVTIRGVITIGAGVLRTNFTDAYIQDESGFGLNVYNGSSNLDSKIKRGNLVILRGVTDSYQGKMEIKNYTATVLKTDVAIPGVLFLSTEEASSTMYEGSFVKIKGAIMEKTYSGGGTNIVLDDGTGPVTVRVWDTANLDLSAYAVGDYVVIHGVISIYSNAGQVLLAYQEDIARPQFNGSPTSLQVVNKPFVPDRGETMVIKYSAGAQNTHITLRVFDLAGRLVTTLKDGEGLPFPTQIEWDGRDQVGQWVPLGTYICHLEVINDDNGKRTVKIAPIVVGTVLSH